MKRRVLLFLQLPLLDNDVVGRHENVPLAALYLQHALKRSPERTHWSCRHIATQADLLDDQALLRLIAHVRPQAIAATLYLWNIERTLHLLAKARQLLPRLQIIVGGPEIAPDHPFISRNPVPDVAVYGEGEPVFPHILHALRAGQQTDFTNVAWRHGRMFVWGEKSPPAYNLATDLPPPRHRGWKPDKSGMAYLETTRGCPLRCAFCCYGHRRSRITALPAHEVIERVRILRARGARDIRFIDPTFNAHPEFETIVEGLARLNRKHKLEFFCELRAETLSAEQAHLLAAANFREIEVGMQSRNPSTLREIRRPTRLAALDRGISQLTRAGVKVTVDLMYGLPGQTLEDIRTMLDWAVRRRGIQVQCLQTLLLPGTELRARRKELKLVASDNPPYAVQSTGVLSAKDIRTAEELARVKLQMQMDCPADCLVGRNLPDLFPEQHRVGVLTQSRGPTRIAGKTNRRALIIHGGHLFEKRTQIASLIRDAVQSEPHILWQFVLEPDAEEPLDLLEGLSEAVKEAEPHVLDRFIDMHSPGKRAARRLMVRLRPDRRYSRDWQSAAEELLHTHFF